MFNAVALDFLGTGRSDRVGVWAHDWWAEGAAAVVGLLDHLGAERALRTEGQVAFWRAAHGDDWAQVVDADTAMIAAYGETGLDYFGGRLGQIACPVLLSASLTDSLLPDIAPQLCAMAQQIARSRLLLVNAGDHPLMWSRPADFRATADAFLGMLLQ